MKIIQTISRIFTGLVFVFSGFVKAIDPYGSAIKFDEYFDAFHVGFLGFSALPLAIILSAMEIMIGVNLIAAIRMKITSWLLIIFISFFTVLTLILALTNPVSDCGCFGDAVVLTNWETFWKNVIILIPAIIVFIRRNDFIAVFTPALEWVMTGFSLFAATMLSVYCIIHLPLLDFRPYKIGANIPENMMIPEGAPLDEYETILIYEKNGVRQEFTSMNYPWKDTTWKWIETKQKLIKKGDVPKIHDFSITSANGNDITEEVMSDTGFTFVLVVHDIEKTHIKKIQQANNLARRSAELGIRFICLTSSTEAQIKSFQRSFNPTYDFYTTDETTLKTIVRANPGVLLLQKGTILGKWNFNDAPRYDELKSDMNAVSLTIQRQKLNVLNVLAVFLIFILVYGTFILISKRII